MKHIDKINALIKEADNYIFSNNCYTAPHGTYSKCSVEMQAWIAECEDFIISTYGEQSTPWKVFSRFNRENLDGNYQNTFDTEKNIIVSALSACLRISPKELQMERSVENNNKETNLTHVFIVHGHDEASKEAVSRFIEKLGFKAIILHEQPNAGKTIIEKFEKYSNVGFAVVLLTPDDIGAARDKVTEEKPRARQNVILELGYFIAKLGREHVCALYKEDVELPSDINGLLYVQLDPKGAWRLSLAKEMKQAGFSVDMNKAV